MFPPFFPGKLSTGRCSGDAGGSLGHVCRVDHSAVACEYQLRHCAAASATGDPAWRQAVTRQKMQMPYVYRSENQHIYFLICTLYTNVQWVPWWMMWMRVCVQPWLATSGQGGPSDGRSRIAGEHVLAPCVSHGNPPWNMKSYGTLPLSYQLNIN